MIWTQQIPSIFSFPLTGTTGDLPIWDSDLGRFVMTSGAALRVLETVEVTSATTTAWTKLAAMKFTFVELWAAGAPGCGGSTANGGSGGSGGMRLMLWVPAYMLADGNIVTGAPGAGGAASGTGGTSADSTFLDVCRAKAGGNAATNTSQSPVSTPYNAGTTTAGTTGLGAQGGTATRDGRTGNWIVGAGGGTGAGTTGSAGGTGGNWTGAVDFATTGGGASGGSSGASGGTGNPGSGPGIGGGGGGGATAGTGGTGGKGGRGAGGGGGGRGSAAGGVGGDGGDPYAKVIQFG